MDPYGIGNLYNSDSSPWDDDEKYYSNNSADASDAEDEYMLYDGVMMNRAPDCDVSLVRNSDSDSNSRNLNPVMMNPKIKRDEKMKKRRKEKKKIKTERQSRNEIGDSQSSTKKTKRKTGKSEIKEKIDSDVILLSSSDDTDSIKVVKVVKKSKKRGELVNTTHEFFPEYSDDSDVNLDIPTDISTNVKSSKIHHRLEETYEPPKKKVARATDNTILTPEQQMRKFYDSDDSDFSIDINRDTSISTNNWDIDKDDSIVTGKRYYQKPVSHVVCYNCRQRGHVGSSCPEPKRIPRCHLCGGAFHKASNCKSQMCSRCLRSGHEIRQCHVSSQILNTRCSRCSVRGHDENYCPDLWRRYYLTKTDGEMKQGSGEKNPRMCCYNCSSKRHWGHKCLKRRMDHHVNASTPFIISYDDVEKSRNMDDSEMTHQIRISNEKEERRLSALKWKKTPRRIRKEESRKIKEKKRQEKRKKKKDEVRKQEKKEFAKTFLHSVKAKIKREKIRSLAKVRNMKQRIVSQCLSNSRRQKNVNF